MYGARSRFSGLESSFLFGSWGLYFPPSFRDVEQTDEINGG